MLRLLRQSDSSYAPSYAGKGPVQPSLLDPSGLLQKPLEVGEQMTKSSKPSLSRSLLLRSSLPAVIENPFASARSWMTEVPLTNPVLPRLSQRLSSRMAGLGDVLLLRGYTKFLSLLLRLSAQSYI